jgi:hypothetical protein
MSAWNHEDADEPRAERAPKATLNGGDQPLPIWIDDSDWIEADLPRRRWVVPRYALRGAVTLVVGPPSALKSSLMLAWATSTALCSPHGDFCPTAPGDVIVYNVEDDQAEQRRRLSATLRQFDATPEMIRGKIVRVGPTTIGTLFSFDKKTGEVTITPAMERLRDLIRERHPALLIADPLAELHGGEENDNTALSAVLGAFRALAVEFDLAVILVHHTRKGTVSPGDPDSARGASSAIGACRIVLTVVTMPEDDAKIFGLPTSRQARSRYIRLDDAKQNYAEISCAEWYEKVPYILENGETVPAAVPWQPPDMWHGISIFAANQMLDQIEIGLPEERRYSPAPQAKERAAWPVVKKFIPSLSDEQAKAAIAVWIKNKVIESRPYHDSADRKEVAGLYVNPAGRPK